ncbi:uncharacterized protein LOC123537228 [Mercenaria mercenaria]|uniref:uncharacterized protein LOC123537228 n=1 Tax=Mercenaria mercenaria TaxID=6596 RepID=UPI00234E40E4|nr:uncharacterized protein LOC123537228 [Mercenaria mercenaria]
MVLQLHRWAYMLHVSQSSVKRRLRLYGLNIRQRYSTITDEQLDERVTQITRDNNALGQRMVQGMLRAEGTHVQRHRIAESLIRVNDVAVAMRWCTSIRRRVYQVSGPNALWHIDGNHKLIRWGFVIHGGIDGYSRVVTFLKVALNNRSETMQQAFFSGTDAYGVPSRLRSDHGLENVGVGAFMIAHRGANRGSFISGRSVHNQRIERLWRDLFQSCTTVFNRLFHHLESTQQLDLSDNVQLWCLQYVYLPRIQKALDRFREAWNHHKMTSEKGRSPHQLFIEGIFRTAGNGQRGVNDLLYEPPNETLDPPENEYGVEEGSVVGAEEGRLVDDTVAIEPPVVDRPINSDSYEVLCQTIDPLDGNGLGVELYSQALEFCVANRA